MKIDNAALIVLNAASGFVCIILAELKHGVEMTLILLPFPILFLVFGYVVEWINIAKLNKQPSTPPNEIQEIHRMAQFGLFIFNIVALLIIWFRPFPVPQDASFWEMVFGLSIYAGFPLLLLYLDFGPPGRELARSRFREATT